MHIHAQAGLRSCLGKVSYTYTGHQNNGVRQDNTKQPSPSAIQYVYYLFRCQRVYALWQDRSPCCICKHAQQARRAYAMCCRRCSGSGHLDYIRKALAAAMTDTEGLPRHASWHGSSPHHDDGQKSPFPFCDLGLGIDGPGFTCHQCRAPAPSLRKPESITSCSKALNMLWAGHAIEGPC